jgi:NADH-quinone oxidoreductase subunit M
MIELHLPWLEFAILMPLLGGLWVSRLRDPDQARQHSLVIATATLICAVGAWIDFGLLGTFQAHDRWDIFEVIFHEDVFVIDELNAPLLPLMSLLFLLTVLATLRTKVRRFSFALTHVSESILLATLTSRLPWAVVAFLIAGTIPPVVELKRRQKPTRVYVLHMSVFAALLMSGQLCMQFANGSAAAITAGVLLTSAAVLIRNGVVPAHCWVTDLFEHASFGTALLFVTPMVGAFGAMRLVLPIAPEWVMDGIAVVSLVTALYAAGMTLVQSAARRFFAYLYLSNSSFILVGFGFLGTHVVAAIGLTGALCVWLSICISLSGFGLTLRSVEARHGRLSLSDYHGMYEQTPFLAAFFLLTGLASIGFPGTIGFIGTELLIDAAVQVSPWVGMMVVIAMALNGLAVLHAYSRVFTGRKHTGTVDLRARLSERLAVLTLTLLILGGGLYPQPGVASRYHAAVELTAAREVLFPHPEDALRDQPLEGELTDDAESAEENDDTVDEAQDDALDEIDHDLVSGSSQVTPEPFTSPSWDGD